MNGQYALMQSSSQHVIDAIGWSGFAGGTCFWIGAYLAVVESLNLNANLLYGAEVERAFGKLKQDLLLRYHRDGRASPDDDREIYCHKDMSGSTVCRPPWRWIGYSNTIGFWASFIQFIGATMFEIAVICGIPGVIGANQWQLQQAFIWTYVWLYVLNVFARGLLIFWVIPSSDGRFVRLHPSRLADTHPTVFDLCSHAFFCSV